MRPLVRFDGIYKCKMKYYRLGLSERSEYNPQFEVVYYKYLRFYRDGSTVSTYTVLPPKKIFSRIKEHMLMGREGSISYSHKNAISGVIELKSGFASIINDKVIVTEGCQATEYRYDFTGVRKCQFPWYKQDEKKDHLLLEYQGFKINQHQVEDVTRIENTQKKSHN